MSFAATALLATVVVAAGVYDLRYRRIPNWLTLSGAAAGLAVNAVDRGWPGLKLSLLGLAAGLGLYLVFYALRAMGAGDVKLMAAVGAIAGLQTWFAIWIVTALLGGVLAVLLSLWKKRLPRTLRNAAFILSEMQHGRPAYLTREDLDVKSERALRLPHGAVIAAGTLLYLGIAAYYKP